jgi:rhodanese-related sulfurtransferase/SAM-dependent methyltransferase
MIPTMRKSIDQLLEEARAQLHRLTPAEAFAAQREGALIVDTRTYEQRRVQGEIPGALIIDRTVFEWRLDPQSPWRIPEASDADVRIVVICHEGYSSSLAAATLHQLGLARATDVIGGFDAWVEAGLPVVPAGPLPDSAPGGGPCGSGSVPGREDHWDGVFGGRADAELSWFQSDPELSVRLVEEASSSRTARVVDVGAGTSFLVDRLLDAGFAHVTVLEVSGTAVDRVRARLGARAGTVRWIVGDVTDVEDLGEVDVWHDRASFHFLTDPADRSRYLWLARRTIVVEGTMILATFAPDAPPRCSGLEVRRYDVDGLAREVGDGFALIDSAHELHVTPTGVRQPFTYAVFRRTERS